MNIFISEILQLLQMRKITQTIEIGIKLLVFQAL